MQTTTPEESSIPYIVPHHLARNHHEELDAPFERMVDQMGMCPVMEQSGKLTRYDVYRRRALVHLKGVVRLIGAELSQSNITNNPCLDTN